MSRTAEAKHLLSFLDALEVCGVDSWDGYDFITSYFSHCVQNEAFEEAALYLRGEKE